jgi:hypothetical protein
MTEIIPKNQDVEKHELLKTAIKTNKTYQFLQYAFMAWCSVKAQGYYYEHLFFSSLTAYYAC